MNARSSLDRVVLSLALAALAGCSWIEAPPYQAPAGQGPAGQDVEVVVTPGEVMLLIGGTATFTAQVTGSAVTSVTWSVAGAGCGSVTPAGVYTAPASPASCVVTASSVAVPAATGSAIVTVTATPPPVAITVSPASGSVAACRTLTLTANVTGSTNRAVTWAVQEAGGGTVSAAGLYTASPDAGIYHVVATAAADPTKRATATITVSDQIISVTVSPATILVAPGGTAQLTANVTTSCGTFASVRTLNADGTLE